MKIFARSIVLVALVISGSMYATAVENSAKPVSEVQQVLPKQPADIDEWLSDFRGKIKENWRPNKENEGNLHTVVDFNVKPDGSIADYKIKTPSGNKDFDRHAIETLVGSQPYSPLPKNYIGNVPVSFTFKFNDYNKMGEDVKYKEWWKDFQTQVQKNWSPTKTSQTQKEYRTTVSFFISDKGMVENCKITNPSKSVEFDNYALKTLMAGQPYKPMPKGANEKVPIKFTFTFNQNNVGESYLYFNNEVKSAIAKKWSVPVKYRFNKEKYEVTMKVTLLQNGKLKECVITKSSGVEEIDENAVKAVHKVAPFKPVSPKYLDYGKEEVTEIVTVSK